MILTKEDLYLKGFDFVIETLNRGESVNLVPTMEVSPQFEEEIESLLKNEIHLAKPYKINEKDF